MQKLLKNTILLISLILCISVFVLNIIYTSQLNNSIEQVIKNTNGIFYLIIVIAIQLGLPSHYQKFLYALLILIVLAVPRLRKLLLKGGKKHVNA